MRALEREAQKWSENGIDSLAKAKKHIKKREELLAFAGQVKRIIGANERKLTTKELEFINKWQTEEKFSLEDIKKAYEITVENTGKCAFGYMNKVLENMKAQASLGAKPQNGKKTPDSRYNYTEFERRAFLNVAKKGSGESGV